MKASPGRLADNTVLCKVTVLLKNTWPGEEKFKKMPGSRDPRLILPQHTTQVVSYFFPSVLSRQIPIFLRIIIMIIELGTVRTPFSPFGVSPPLCPYTPRHEFPG